MQRGKIICSIYFYYKNFPQVKYSPINPHTRIPFPILRNVFIIDELKTKVEPKFAYQVIKHKYSFNIIFLDNENKYSNGIAPKILFVWEK